MDGLAVVRILYISIEGTDVNPIRPWTCRQRYFCRVTGTGDGLPSAPGLVNSHARIDLVDVDAVAACPRLADANVPGRIAYA